MAGRDFRHLGIGGLQGKILSAKMYGSGAPLRFEQSDFRVKLEGLPKSAPDRIATVIALEMDLVPKQDNLAVRINRNRERV